MYLAVLGREPKLSIAELEALFGQTRQVSSFLSLFESKTVPDINRLGGSLKLAEKLNISPLDFLSQIEGKITFGISDYSKNASKKSAGLEAMKLKKILTRHGRSVRVVQSQDAIISTATSLHNGLSGKNPRKCELIKVENNWYKVIGVQDIDAYAQRDQARPARDAKVGMLPPKLAQILINLCGPLESNATVLDPFCGTGVVLQEALLMGYSAYGTDINEKMIEYSKKNLEWLTKLKNGHLEGIRSAAARGVAREPRGRPPEEARERQAYLSFRSDDERTSRMGDGSERRGPRNDRFQVSHGDATNSAWTHFDAVACECYLGRPFSKIPSDLELKEQKQICSETILGFLKNLSGQIKADTPVVIAIPAWLRPDGAYSRLEIVDEIKNMGYNVNNKSREGLFYYREGQIVARDIIILRKK